MLHNEHVICQVLLIYIKYNLSSALLVSNKFYTQFINKTINV